MKLTEIVFFLSLFGILHTYLIYPTLLLLLKRFFPKTSTPEVASLTDLPTIEIIFAAYNEESVIREKILSSFHTTYPLEKLIVTVGTDNCSDETDAILTKLQKEFPNLNHQPFNQRTGKAGIINKLTKASKADYLILTDANIIFKKDTISQLLSTITNEAAGIVGGNIEYFKNNTQGISNQEKSYLQLENRIKEAESELFGKVMGVEGGCYIIRRDLFPNIPPLFFMEDFFVSLSVIEKKYKVLFNSKAVCFEDVSTHKQEEFKRKVRISIGNFQNLNRFKTLVFKEFFPVGLAFLSHKILRWLSPFFLILLFASSLFLMEQSAFYQGLVYSYFAFLFLGILGILFSQNKTVSWIKYPGHFLYMNLALLKGFFIYLKGVNTNVWQPTSRNQE
jgi:cellulose synthase/poly-beta-1,6-N-acetylglucosamine synthase-like glycosyltransferase